MTPEESANQNAKIQKDAEILRVKTSSRMESLRRSLEINQRPIYGALNQVQQQVAITTQKVIKDAQEIYDYLIKDIPTN